MTISKRLIDRSRCIFGFLDNSCYREWLANQRFTDLNTNYVTESLIGQPPLPRTVSKKIINIVLPLLSISQFKR